MYFPYMVLLMQLFQPSCPQDSWEIYNLECQVTNDDKWSLGWGLIHNREEHPTSLGYTHAGQEKLEQEADLVFHLFPWAVMGCYLGFFAVTGGERLQWAGQSHFGFILHRCCQHSGERVAITRGQESPFQWSVEGIIHWVVIPREERPLFLPL